MWLRDLGDDSSGVDHKSLLLTLVAGKNKVAGLLTHGNKEDEKLKKRFEKAFFLRKFSGENQSRKNEAEELSQENFIRKVQWKNCKDSKILQYIFHGNEQ